MHAVSFTTTTPSSTDATTHTEYHAPYYMGGNFGDWIGQLNLSLYTTGATVVVTGYHDSSTPCWTTTLQVGPPPLPGKRGACLTMRDEGRKGSWVENIPRLISLDPYWSYSWGNNKVAAHPSNVEFVPMLWGAKQDVASTVTRIIAEQSPKRILGFNEPDKQEQSNIPVERAVQEWTGGFIPSVEGTGVSLVSPSPAAPAGTWMQSFMDAPGVGDSIDWVGVHWYSHPNFTNFKQRMEEYHAAYGNRPLLITEFAVADWNAQSAGGNRHSPETVLAFMKQALPWLEATPWIAGYAWFSFAPDFIPGAPSALFTEDGSLTTLGQYYASVRTDRPEGDQSIGE